MLALVALFIFGMALVFHYAMTDNSAAMFFWMAVVTGGVPAGILLIWQNLRARVTGKPLSIHDIAMPIAIIGLVSMVAAAASSLFYGA